MDVRIQRYGDIWYGYIPQKNAWVVADGPNWAIATICYYNDSFYRIDQAINQFINEYMI